MSKLDIDVLVQLAWLGPLEAEAWRPRTDDPDELGAELWTRNYEANADEGDPPLPEYTFNALPVQVTAVEGLKHVSCYRYQTGEALGTPYEGDAIPTLIAELVGSLQAAIPGWEEAPWGWNDATVQDRMDRPHPVVPVERRPREAAARGLERYTTAGFVPADPYPHRESPHTDPRKVLAAFVYPGMVPGEMYQPWSAMIMICADDEGAHRVFSDSVEDGKNRGQMYHGVATMALHVYRFGNTVLTTSDPTIAPGSEPGRLDILAANLGEPDEHWYNRDEQDSSTEPGSDAS